MSEINERRIVILISTIATCYVMSIFSLILATVYGVENAREIRKLKELL